MKGINKVIIIGHLGSDPEMHHFQSGHSVTNISIATSERWTDKQGIAQEVTEWHRVQLFNRLGEIAYQYLKKGSKIYIEGSLRTRKWTDSDSIVRYTTEIRANKMQMLDSKSEANKSEHKAVIKREQPVTEASPESLKSDPFLDDIPPF